MVRHAGATAAVVPLGHERGQLLVEVADDGRAEPAAGNGCGIGNGLRGMRERAATAGGTVVAEPRPSGIPGRAAESACSGGRGARDPGAARRRPDAGPGRVPVHPGRRGRTSRWSARPPTAPRRCAWPARLRPDVVLMDIRMPGARRPGGHPPDHRRPPAERRAGVILTTFDLDEYVYGALRAGASGFLVKDTEPAELIHAVRVVAARRRAARADRHPPADRRVRGPGHRAADPAPRAERAHRAGAGGPELVAAGLSNDEIAARLVISPATAKTHVSRMHDQARRPRPGPARRPRLRVRAGQTGLAQLTYISGCTP